MSRLAHWKLRRLLAAWPAALLLGGAPSPLLARQPAGQPAGQPAVPRASGPAAGALGRIEGTVVISSALVARRPRFRIYNDPGPGALPPPAARADSSAEMQNVVVYVAPTGAGASLAAGGDAGASRALMTQRDETFEPHVLSVLRGTAVEFPNADDVFHNVFSLSSAKAFDLGRYPQGGTRAQTFDKPGRVDVFCHIHSDMNAIILVLENPYFATPDQKGHFVIDAVPPGDYTVVGWHQRVVPVQQHVHVVAGETSKTLFAIPIPPPEAR